MTTSFVLVFDRNAGAPAFLKWDGSCLTLNIDDARLFDSAALARGYAEKMGMECELGAVLTRNGVLWEPSYSRAADCLQRSQVA